MGVSLMKTKICCFLTMLFVLSLCAVLIPNNTKANIDSAYINPKPYLDGCFLDEGFGEEDYYEKKLFAIKEIEHFENFARLMTINELDFEGKKIVLLDDLILTESISFLPSNSPNANFKGTFDGRGFEIQNLSGCGLFYENSGTIMNLNLTNVNLNSTSVGAVAVYNLETGTIFNCKVSGSITGTGNVSNVGGITASNEGTINYCQNNAVISVGNNNSISKKVAVTGGIAAVNSGEIFNCSNTARIEFRGYFKDSIGFMGGIAGSIVLNNSGKKNYMINCYNLGILNADVGNNNADGNTKFYLGGILGSVEGGGSNDDFTLENCYNKNSNSISANVNNGNKLLGKIIGSLSLNAAVQKSIKDLHCETGNTLPACGFISTGTSIISDNLTNQDLLNALKTYVDISSNSSFLKWQNGINGPELVPIQYYVTFNTNGGDFPNNDFLNKFYCFEFKSFEDEDTDVFEKYYYFYQDETYILPDLEKEGYNFEGWFYKNDEEIDVELETIEKPYENLELFAKFLESVPDFNIVVTNAEFIYNNESLVIKQDSNSNLVVTNDEDIQILLSGVLEIDTIKLNNVSVPIKNAKTYEIDFEIRREGLDEIFSGSFTITINTATIEIQWSDTVAFIYSGNNQKPTINNVITNNDVEILPESIQITGGTDVGNYTATASIDNNNYIIINPTKPFTIEEATITLTWSDTKTFTYNGEKQTPSFTVRDISNDQNLSISLIDIEIQDGNGIDASDELYTAIASIINNNNYIIENGTESCEFKINKATIIITWLNTELIYSGISQIPERIITDNLGEELNNINLDVKIWNKLTKEFIIQSINAGEYTVEAFSTDNYEILGDNAQIEFKINKATVSGVTIALINWVEGSTPNNHTISNLPIEFNSLTPTVEYKSKGAADSTYSATKPTAIGEYTIRVTYGETANYNGFSSTANFSVTVKSSSAPEGSDSPIDLVLVLGCVGAGVVALFTILIVVKLAKKRQSRFVKLSDNNNNDKK